MHIVLDLDETLIHSETRALPGRPHDFYFEPFFVWIRPGALEFIQFCQQHCQSVNVWTAATSGYAREIVNRLFVIKPHIVYTQKNCAVAEDGMLHKPLRKIIARRPGMTLANTVMVDDRVHTARENFHNIIPMPPFNCNPQDNMLPRLREFISVFLFHQDVRRVNKLTWWNPNPFAFPFNSDTLMQVQKHFESFEKQSRQARSAMHSRARLSPSKRRSARGFSGNSGTQSRKSASRKRLSPKSSNTQRKRLSPKRSAAKRTAAARNAAAIKGHAAVGKASMQRKPQKTQQFKRSLTMRRK